MHKDVGKNLYSVDSNDSSIVGLLRSWECPQRKNTVPLSDH